MAVPDWQLACSKCGHGRLKYWAALSSSYPFSCAIMTAIGSSLQRKAGKHSHNYQQPLAAGRVNSHSQQTWRLPSTTWSQPYLQLIAPASAQHLEIIVFVAMHAAECACYRCAGRRLTNIMCANRPCNS